MVFFTCNACGQSIKKAQVEKHYLTRCRNCEILSCIDCGKDFVGDDYKHHTKCVSENEKYGGKDYTAKPNKGEVKQSHWIECIQAVSSSQTISPRVRNLLQRLANYDNIPRKKNKFQRFVQNCLKVWDVELIEEIWTVFSEAGKKEQAKVKEAAGGDPGQEQRITATGSISENRDSMSRRPTKHSNKAGQDTSRNEDGENKGMNKTGCSNEVNEKGDDQPPKKKKKDNAAKEEVKSHEKRPVEKQVLSSEEVSQEDIETPKKRRKHKQHHHSAAVIAADGIGGSSKDKQGDSKPPEKKKKKKKKKDREGAKDTEGHTGVKDGEKKAAEEVDLVEGNSGLENGELPKTKKKSKDLRVDNEVLNGGKRPIDELSCSAEDGTRGESESSKKKKKTKKKEKEQQLCDGEASAEGLGGKNTSEVEHDLPELSKRKPKKRHADIDASNGVDRGDGGHNTTGVKKSKKVCKEEFRDGGDDDQKNLHKGGTEKMTSSNSAEDSGMDGLLSDVAKKKRKIRKLDDKDEVSPLRVVKSEMRDGLLGAVESDKKAKKKKRKRDSTSKDLNKLDSGKMHV